MSEYPNSGAMFQNDKQRPGSRDADRNGSAHITCPSCNREHEFWLNGWIKNGQKGQFLSVSFKPKEARPTGGTTGKPAAKSAPAPVYDDDNSDVPF